MHYNIMDIICIIILCTLYLWKYHAYEHSITAPAARPDPWRGDQEYVCYVSLVVVLLALVYIIISSSSSIIISRPGVARRPAPTVSFHNFKSQISN